MRKMAMFGFAGLVVTMAANGSAGDARDVGPAVAGTLSVAPPIAIVGFHRSTPTQGQTYSGGGIAMEVAVQNKGDVPFSGMVKLTSGGDVIEAPITVKAHSVAIASLSDAEGLDSVCAPKSYGIEVTGSGLAAVKRSGKVTPTCTFSSTVESTWNQMTPDHVEAEKSGSVYLASATLVQAPTCSKGAMVRARLVSNSMLSSPSLIVQAKDATAPGKVRATTEAAFPFAPKEQKDVLLTPTHGSTSDVPAKMNIAIVDWTKSLKGKTANGGLFVQTTRACQLAFLLQ